MRKPRRRRVRLIAAERGVAGHEARDQDHRLLGARLRVGWRTTWPSGGGARPATRRRTGRPRGPRCSRAAPRARAGGGTPPAGGRNPGRRVRRSRELVAVDLLTPSRLRAGNPGSPFIASLWLTFGMTVTASEELFAPVGREVELCYQTFGTPDGEPLLLVMGLGGPMTWWDARAVPAAGRPRFPRDPLRQPRLRPLQPGRRPGDSNHAGPGRRRPSGAGAVLPGRHGRGRLRAPRPPRARVRARLRRLDGRHDRPDHGDRAPGAGALADQHHVDHRQAHGRLAAPLAAAELPGPTGGPRRLHRDRATGPGGSSAPRPTRPARSRSASALARPTTAGSPPAARCAR